MASFAQRAIVPLRFVADPVWSRPPPRPPRALPAHADVVVVGGGITGAALMHWLRGRDLQAVLLERRHLAAGASGRNAGFVLTGVAANYALAVRQHGREVAAEVWRFTVANHTLLAEILDGRAGHLRRGSLTLAASAEEAALLEESGELLREDRLPGRILRVGGATVLATDGDGELDPAAAVDAVAGDAPVCEGVTVQSLECGQDGGVRVHTSAGEVRAGIVVLATNAYTAHLVAAAPIAPVRAQMLATGRTVHRVAERPTYSHWGYRYWRQRDDGTVLLGGWRDTALNEEVGTEPAVNVRVQAHLDAALRDMGLGVPVTHRWAGIMGFSPDELPLVGPVPDMPGIYVCAGYTGHGMGFAVHATRVLVAHLLDGAAIPAWLRSDRLAW